MLPRLRYFPLLAGLATLAVTALVAWFLHVEHQTQQRERLSVAAERIEKRVANNILALQAIRGAFIGGQTIPTRQFLADMIGALPWKNGLAGVQGYAFAMASPPDNATVATEMVTQSYGVRRPPWPETDQPIRFPIVLIEPMDARNDRALNYDMYSEPVRRAAMQAAERTGRPAATDPVLLKQEDNETGQTGLLIYVPVYARDGLTAPGITRAPDQAIGFVYAPIRSGDLIEQVLAEDPPLNVGVEVYSDLIVPDMLLHRSSAALRDPVTVPISVADRIWIVRVGDFAMDWRGPAPVFFVALIGVFLSGAVAALSSAHLRMVDATARLAEETRKRVDQQQVLLGESQHRIKNSIARKLALFRMTARETQDRETLIRTYEARLQSMAHAQQLLHAEPGGGLPIERLLEQELGQWQGRSGIHWSGPDVRLEGSQLQALGLIIHEMATNSLKYGALATGRALEVTWRVDEQAQPAGVEFVWREQTDAPAAPVGKAAGFGSRLIRIMIEGQLGGFEQHSHENGELSLAIRFPLTPATRPAR